MNRIWKGFTICVSIVVLGLITVSAFSKSPSDVTTITVYKPQLVAVAQSGLITSASKVSGDRLRHIRSNTN